MTIAITQEVKHQTVVTFWVAEDTNSPYQGILYYNTEIYNAMSPSQIAVDQTNQFEAWKANLAALQAQAEVPPVDPPAP